MPAIVYIILNGFPGVGKLSLGQELCRVLPQARLFNNHLLIDPAAALFERSDPAYKPYRRALKRAVTFEALEASLSATPSNATRYVVFTESQSTDAEGSAVIQEYLSSSQHIGASLISLVLNCEANINEHRLQIRAMDKDQARVTKLSDIGILRRIRETAVIYHYGQAASLELQVDVSTVTAAEAANEIMERIMAV